DRPPARSGLRIHPGDHDLERVGLRRPGGDGGLLAEAATPMEGRVGAGARSPGREGEPVEENSAADHPAVRARPYLGLAAPGRSEVVIKKSRFLGYARPVETAAEAEEYIAALREDHREARHVCFAYRVGLEREEVRSSDDGEPSGTA